LVISCHG
ncbi:unnamed protein product, partial [Alternaria burnsii]